MTGDNNRRRGNGPEGDELVSPFAERQNGTPRLIFGARMPNEFMPMPWAPQGGEAATVDAFAFSEELEEGEIVHLAPDDSEAESGEEFATGDQLTDTYGELDDGGQTSEEEHNASSENALLEEEDYTEDLLENPSSLLPELPSEELDEARDSLEVDSWRSEQPFAFEDEDQVSQGVLRTPETWSELELPPSVFPDEEVSSDEDEHEEFTSFEVEAVTALEAGLSPLARRNRMHPGHGDRKAPWLDQVYGLVVHTTGGSLPGKARNTKVAVDEYAVNHYAGTGGTHYVNGWAGADGNQLHQVMNERKIAWGVGKVKGQPKTDQWRSIDAGRFEADLPPTVLRLWRARWPGVTDSLSLLPVRSSANLTYLHVECPPCVYYRNGDKELITDHEFAPMRAGLRFTRAQHETIARLAWDIAQRHGWPAGAWWRTARLVGHEDLTPLSRHDANGGWDPGGLRDAPYFDWQFVYDQLTSLSAGIVPTAVVGIAPRAGQSTVGGLLGTLSDKFRQLVTVGQIIPALTVAIAGGQVDAGNLTSLVFFARHPELNGRRIRPDEKQLAAEWLHIRDTVVVPLLARLAPAGRATVTGSPAGTVSPRPQAPSAGTATAGGLATERFGKLTVSSPDRYRFTYQLTSQDASWVARLITGESGGRNDIDSTAVIWAVLNRFALFAHSGSYWMTRAKLRGYSTLAEFVQAYSTTLQPELKSSQAAARAIRLAKANPSKFQYVETGGTYKGTTIPKGQLKHHLERIQRLSWSKLPEATRTVVKNVFAGAVASPVGLASEFANTATYFKDAHGRAPNQAEWLEFTRAHGRRKHWSWVGDVPKLRQFASNAFFIDDRVKDLPPETVRVVM